MKNKLIGKKLAHLYNRNYGLITYSGTLAIEYSLKVLDLKKKSNVLLISSVCSSIVNTIVKCNLTPLIIEPYNGYSLSDIDLEDILKKYDVSCILLVHQYGMMNDINITKYKSKNIKIIEDVSQIFINEKIKESDSDIIITSFGNTKPLSYGIGGALLFNNKDYFIYADYCNNDSRNSKFNLLSYLYPLSINIEKLIKKANKIIKNQKKNAYKYYSLLKKCQHFKIIYDGNISSYHRLILKFDDLTLYERFKEIIKKSSLEYQLPHDIDLIDLPICNKSIKVKVNSSGFIFIRTRNVNINKQLKNLRIIINKINNML